MAIQGKHVKQRLLAERLTWLWLGKADKAIQVVQDGNKEIRKNKKERENVIQYVERKRRCIPCSALRKKLGLRASSHPVEKANDSVVSERQKQNDMSWSADGSLSLATLTNVRHHCEQKHWLFHHDIHVTFDADAQHKAASKAHVSYAISQVEIT